MSKTTFKERCSRCNTLILIKEEGLGYPFRDKEPIICPVCDYEIGYKSSRYDLVEYVESLADTKEPFKTAYLNK